LALLRQRCAKMLHNNMEHQPVTEKRNKEVLLVPRRAIGLSFSFSFINLLASTPVIPAS